MRVRVNEHCNRQRHGTNSDGKRWWKEEKKQNDDGDALKREADMSERERQIKSGVTAIGAKKPMLLTLTTCRYTH